MSDHTKEGVPATSGGKETKMFFMRRGGPEERVRRALFRLRSHRDLMGIGVMADTVREIKPVPNEKAGKMSTNGRGMYFDPKYVQSISDAELRFVVLHNLMHIAFGHHFRMKGKNLYVANMAADMVINRILRQSQAFQDGFIEWPEGGIFDERFNDNTWHFESIYFKLMQEYKKMMEEASSDGEEGEGQGDEEGEDSGGWGEVKADGDEEGEGQGGDGPNRPDSLSQNQGWGECWDHEQSMTPQEIRQEMEYIRGKLDHSRMTEKMIGSKSGNIAELVSEPAGDIAQWDMLRQMLEDIYSYERTWARPNLTFHDHGYLPARKKAMGTLHICIDTSGSVTHEEAQLYLANTRAICADLGIPTLKIAYVDSRLHRTPEGEAFFEIDVHGGDEIEFDMLGRGGTHFDPIFQAIEEDQEEVTAMIYFTDGEGHCTVPQPQYHVIWATSGQRPYAGSGNGYVRWGHHLTLRAHAI